MLRPLCRPPARRLSLVPAGNYVSELHSAGLQTPDRPALVDGVSGTTLSFSALRQATLQTASGLEKRGLGRGATLAVVLPNTADFVLAVHGAVGAGGVASPLNCHATAQELAHPLSAASAVVTNRERLETVRRAAPGLPVLLTEATAAAAAEVGCSAFREVVEDDGRALGDFAEVRPDDLAFLPFSSGTTGLPKGVMLSHANVGANLRQQRAKLRNPRAQEVALGVLPFYHIYGMNTQLGNTLHNAGTIVTLPQFEPELFLSLVERHSICVLHLVPPLLLFLLQSPLVKDFRLSSLRTVMSGAAPLGEDTETEMDALLARVSPQAQFFQAYGLTETSPYTHANVRHDEQQDRRVGSIGAPVPGLECRVVDLASRQDVGVGETGELAMRGPNVMRGYLNRPDDTAACLDDDGWFYTGDIARQDEHGFFFVTDRAKELIKYKGFQVAPAELEATLLTHPEILDCAVIGKPDQRSGEVPMAFVVRRSDELNAIQVQDHIAGLLSDYKQLRGGVKFVSQIPKSPSGKILRRQLKDFI